MSFHYSPKFHRRAPGVLAADESAVPIATDMWVSGQTTDTRRNQDLIDTGSEPDLIPEEAAELLAAQQRIAVLETEMSVTRRADEPMKEGRCLHKEARSGLGDRL